MALQSLPPAHGERSRPAARGPGVLALRTPGLLRLHRSPRHAVGAAGDLPGLHPQIRQQGVTPTRDRLGISAGDPEVAALKQATEPGKLAEEIRRHVEEDDADETPPGAAEAS
jgi:hypothetical protein